MIDFEKAPASGRRETLLTTLRLLHERTRGDAVIVEIGTSRGVHPLAATSDGYSTRVFGWYGGVSGASLISIDPNPRAIANAQKVCSDYLPWIHWITAPAELALPGIDRIDLLYMDGPPDPRAHFHYWLARQVDPPLVLWDDILSDDFKVKGEIAIPRMLEYGYSLVFNEKRQALLTL